MNRAKILELAQESGMGIEPDFLNFLENFGRRLIEETREECANICYYVSIDLVGEDSVERCAEEIRLLNEDMQ